MEVVRFLLFGVDDETGIESVTKSEAIGTGGGEIRAAVVSSGSVASSSEEEVSSRKRSVIGRGALIAGMAKTLWPKC